MTDTCDLDRIRKDAMDFANVGIFRYTMDGKIVFMDAGCIRLLDLESRYPDSAMLVGQDLGSLFEYLDSPGSLRDAVKADGYVRNFEFHYRTHTGEERWVYHNSYLVQDPETKQELVQVIAQDITVLKTTTLALEQSERRYRALAEQSLQGICLLDAHNMEILFANRAMAEIAGLKLDELVGLTGDAIWDGIHRDDLFETQRHIREGASGEKLASLFDFRVIRPDKSICWVSTMYAPIEFEGQPAFQVVLTDITEKKEQEIRRRDDERRQFHAQKLESLGVLAGGIAHDFNNLLAGILGNADLAEVRIGDNDAVRTHLGRAKEATEQAAKLCQQLLAYAGKGQVTIERIDLGRVIKESASLLEVSTSKKAIISLNLFEKLPRIQGDPSQIRQVLMNIVINASEAIGHNDGHINIETRVDDLHRDQLDLMHHGKQLRQGPYVVMEISDNGGGMSADILKQVFDPFFTTKFTGRGLGLASVLGILRSHGGAVRIESEPDKGTCFTIAFPTNTQSEEKSLQMDSTTAPWKGDGIALVADDEPLVLNATIDIMEFFGFEVVAVKDGEAAVKAFETDEDRIKLVLLDITMPGMDGLEACRQIRNHNAKVPILLSSGFNEHNLTVQVKECGGSGFLSKPYRLGDMEQLLATLF